MPRPSSTLSFHGPADNPHVIVFAGRNDAARDHELVDALTQATQGSGYTLVCHSDPCSTANAALGRHITSRWPRLLRQLIQGLRLLPHPRLWRHYSRAYRHRVAAPGFRSQCLAHALQTLGPRQHLIVVARSASAVLASRIADSTAIDALITVGYPFRHPQRPDERWRYQHLAQLRTPLFIIQGEQDPYGGREAEALYARSSAVRLLFVEGGHELTPGTAAWTTVLQALQMLLRGTGKPPMPSSV